MLIEISEIIILPELLKQIIISVAIGGLIGIERESAPHKKYAGIRTITLISMSGPISVKLSNIMNSPAPIAIFLLLEAILSIIIIYIRLKIAEEDIGATTTATIFLVSLISLLVGFSLYFEAVSISIITTIILAEKKYIHTQVKELTRKEITDALKVCVLAFIIYPLLPSETLTQYGLINPQRTLLFILLVLGIRFSAFIIGRKTSEKQGIPLTGFLGGTVSSLATTGALAELGKKQELMKSASLGIILAATSMILRNYIIATISSFETAKYLTIPLTLAIIISTIFSYQLWKGEKRKHQNNLKKIIKSPLALKPALKLGFYFLIITIMSNLTQNLLGTKGIWIIALIGGLVSSAAVTISATSLLNTQSITAQTGSIMIILGSISSMIVKIILTGTTKNKKILKKIIPPLILMSIASLLPFLI